jgi:hypothetical protein
LLDILTMYLPINVKSPNNISKWQIEFNSAFKGLILCVGFLAYCPVLWVITLDRWPKMLQNLTLEPAGYQELTAPQMYYVARL